MTEHNVSIQQSSSRTGLAPYFISSRISCIKLAGKLFGLSLMIVLSCLLSSCTLCADSKSFVERENGDWLIDPSPYKAEVKVNEQSHEVVLSNGLVRRVWRLQPNAATIALDNLMTGESMLRGVKPEAVLELDGRHFEIGGLKGQPNYAYLLPEWIDKLTSDPNAFGLEGLAVGKTKEPFSWKRKRYSTDMPWPPAGVSLRLDFCFKEPPQPNAPRQPFGEQEQTGQTTAYPKDITVSVHYEMYDGIPVICKWIEVQNGSGQPVKLNSFKSEILAIVEGESPVDESPYWAEPGMHVESDYAFGGMNAAGANKTCLFVPDPEYKTQVNYLCKTPCLLVCTLPGGPDITIQPGDKFVSFRTFELPYDSTDRERRGLAVRRMYRTIAPWVTENPILMHVRSAEPKSVRLAIDQCAEAGFEMVILTFGSGFNIESENPEYLAELKELADYAHSREIELGGYSLLASRQVSDQDDVVNPATGKPGGFARFGNSPCIGSKWGQEYFRKLYAFYEKTGFDLLEHDGSYPGDFCASTAHPGHAGYADSQHTQHRTITDFYKWCRGKGIYLNVPDYYYLSGTNKSGMGYRETNWSLPRAQQIIHGRQNIYDGTWEKTPSMGWMFVPLTQYHGGGAAATIEPLEEHLDAYEAHLANNFGAGVQACYRGPRLYDSEKTKAVVKKWVDFYRSHRQILDSDIIHIRRADGKDIDCMMHVNSQLREKALVMVYNPAKSPVRKNLKLPMYYTGLTETARLRNPDGKDRVYKLDRQYNITIPVEISAESLTWFVITE
ncbi:MAG: hypothetical protein L0Y36_05925 [Planctomycetales bacterium]|nr:hypothetical protein [Planctomycetales bacterium]